MSMSDLRLLTRLFQVPNPLTSSHYDFATKIPTLFVALFYTKTTFQRKIKHSSSSKYLSITPLALTKSMMRKRGSHEYDGDSGNTNSKRHLLLWILAAVILIALWSMFAGTVTLKWSLSNNDDLDSTILEVLDVLEVEEREKVVRHMWDVYSRSTHTKSVGLPKFWWEAFEAAYQQLVSDVPAVRDAAVSEIAKMSLRSLPIQIQSHSSIAASRKIKQAKSRAGQ